MKLIERLGSLLGVKRRDQLQPAFQAPHSQLPEGTIVESKEPARRMLPGSSRCLIVETPYPLNHTGIEFFEVLTYNRESANPVERLHYKMCGRRDGKYHLADWRSYGPDHLGSELNEDYFNNHPHCRDSYLLIGLSRVEIIGKRRALWGAEGFAYDIQQLRKYGHAELANQFEHEYREFLHQKEQERLAKEHVRLQQALEKKRANKEKMLEFIQQIAQVIVPRVTAYKAWYEESGDMHFLEGDLVRSAVFLNAFCQLTELTEEDEIKLFGMTLSELMSFVPRKLSSWELAPDTEV